MKPLALVAFFFTLASSALAEIFLGSSNSFNALLVPSNQVALISAVRIGAHNEINGADTAIGLLGEVLQNGTTNIVKFRQPSSGPYAITGACQIVFKREIGGETWSAPVVVSYALLRSPALKSVIIAPGSTNVIEVPSGKRIRFFTPTLTSGQSQRFTIVQGMAAIHDVTIGNGDEFTGPLTLTYKFLATEDYAQLLSYYVTEDFLIVPETGLLQGPTGSFELTAEKSVDLTNWFPVIVHNTAVDQKAFYRLKLSR